MLIIKIIMCSILIIGFKFLITLKIINDLTKTHRKNEVIKNNNLNKEYEWLFKYLTIILFLVFLLIYMFLNLNLNE